MIEMQAVTRVGQIKVGDTLVVENSRGVKFIAQARVICREGTDKEEICFTKKSNKYFIMELYLDGKSWVKNISILKDVKLFAISNTMVTEKLCY